MKVKIEIMANLMITKEEAIWLREYTQNNIGSAVESDESLEIRRKFYNAAKQITAQAWGEVLDD